MTTKPLPKFLKDPPRFLFFTGKGGVGKTSIACAAAVALARVGRRVLLVSTDPASNIGQVFGLSIGNNRTAIPHIDGLFALEIDPEQAVESYRERILGPLRDVLEANEISSMTEQLSGSCTTEIASFNEFTTLLADDTATATFDHVLFDTAPTGHTIRLLQLPGSWSEFLTAGGDASCLGPLSGLDKHKDLYSAAVRALADPNRTRLVLVARPARSALSEIDRTRAELASIGMTTQYVVVNGVLPVSTGTVDTLAAAVHRRERAALDHLPSALRSLPLDLIELKATNLIGVEALTTLFETAPPSGGMASAVPTVPAIADAPLAALIDDIVRDGHCLIMCMGKGGVGKTTVAAAVAVALAERGHDVHLTTTDPAANLTETLDGTVDHLQVSRIDPARASRAYRDRVMTVKGATLDEAGRAALAEDLRSPCTDEIAVFQAFSHVIAQSRHKYVVVDTAPTGHTLLLLDATGSYHRDITRQMVPGVRFITPLMRLQDPTQTKVLLVTLAETTPVLEAAELQADLERAGIQTWAWVVDNSLAAANPTAPLLRRRAATELEHIRDVTTHSRRYAVIPMLPEEPVGIPALTALARPAKRTAGAR
ncbi:arsenical pump-driving ATPase [Antrihabitans sp. YC3-6]|uniref:Arsenical pump-driving ATPase n=1 Tax=Antrihabitans stalagmiti TaxID=2799499 RepID=A0A934NU17_9NOCA|nr:arsenical pump-driving ATPase [Antrihabitans stalagmiti]MBJ8341288.1 arsenical pump-driving ATPase [Antrihabitans stalagmiti]